MDTALDATSDTKKCQNQTLYFDKMKQKNESIIRLPAVWEAQGYGGKEFLVSHRLRSFYVVNAEIIGSLN